MTISTRRREQQPTPDLTSQRRDVIVKLADAGLSEAQAAAEVDALCKAACACIAQDLAVQVTALRERRDAAGDWITRDSLSYQLRALVKALATALGNPQDTKAAHGYVLDTAKRNTDMGIA
ncbi:hypothetical protein OG413_44710 [Streptomyces sp. NBC_01433]|uniref:hypothetical protein n=1 Tax=Streptomyces sp. NBC_01433 TaxID=2903864 RepID=UPI0022527798|nr:hypothetical protein [Streptomyces sp. NBC_01433]MCX4682287.1 hypothetical protein [Streptomyces sp. NBC_01433]